MDKTTVEYCKEIDQYKNAITLRHQATEKLIREHADAEVNYKRIVAVTEATLRSQGTPVSILKDQVFDDDGVCKALHAHIVAEKSLRANSDAIESLRSCMNATQSQNRHLDSL